MAGNESVVPAHVLWEDTIRGGAAWSHVLKRGTALRINDTEGGANVGAIFYNFECPVERYNMPDTLKAQHTGYLTKGLVLYSDMGRVLCSVTEDSCGWHDPIGGHSNAAMVEAKYGEARYQQHRNDYHRNARENFLMELGKWGLGERDLNANVNFFSKVVVGEDGGMTLQPGNSSAGAYVELRAEMNVLVILDTCQHALDAGVEYAPKSVHVSIRRVAPPGADDPCRVSRPENGRGFINTERYFL
ncbi:MAG: urea carboxylase-associated family protein [Bryobacterales bacterium]|nr:urea carboxylase-associated family protein [Bryobacterales bacterium]